MAKKQKEKKSDILQVDDLNHIEQKENKLIEKIEKKKAMKEEKIEKEIKIESKDLRHNKEEHEKANKEENKKDEFPEIEIGFDPFQDQTKK